MWIVSTGLLLAYFYHITLKNPFKTVAKHFAILLLMHVLLYLFLAGLTTIGWLPISHKPHLLETVKFFLKIYMVVALIVMINFFAALSQFFTGPGKGLYKMFFIIGGIFMLWAIWFRTDI
ncbi:hypothetical protein FJU30_09945 [Affinibrenneria salicis]|uniref:Uncharacterized protein n=1 Tax=Affinibrenneria salicis TaxID=2590031 RepID=A0A5J5G3C7_9GAMM|nr:hypothetical protein [Affinibrenneria salicis]KAA9000543.1 hypothetical protein FJU30_09945 [Affinibrenneria salicis]